MNEFIAELCLHVIMLKEEQPDSGKQADAASLSRTSWRGLADLVQQK